MKAPSKVSCYSGQGPRVPNLGLLITVMTFIHQTCQGSSAVCQALGHHRDKTDKSPCSLDGETDNRHTSK